MEALSLLKYWRASPAANVRNPTTTITVETDDDEDDEGPFFDLEFAVPDDDDDDEDEDEDEDDQENRDADEQGDGSEETDGEREFDLAVSSGMSQERTDPNLTLSPSDDLFFKGRLVPLEPSSLAFNPSEPNSKPQFPVSLLKSATKFRIFLLGFKKPKPTAETNGATPPPKQQQQQQSKLFTVKFKVEEVPIVSLFTRDNSSRNSGSKNHQQQQQQQTVEDVVSDDGMSASDAKRFAKDVVHKYLKMIKPLYVKVSRKYGEKLRFSGQLSLGSGKTSPTTNNEGVPAAQGEVESMPAAAAATTTTSTSTSTTTPAPPAAPTNISKNQKQGNLPAGLRVVCKHLGKSRSASAAVAAVAPSPLQAQQRRDDSLFQQQDGIQSAIAHCKRSFNASKKEVEERSLPRSVSDTSADKSGDVCLTSSGKGKEACI